MNATTPQPPVKRLYRFYKPASTFYGQRSYRFAWEQVITAAVKFFTDEEANAYARWLWGSRAFAERVE